MRGLIEELLFSPFIFLAVVGLAFILRFRSPGCFKPAYRICLGGLIFTLILSSTPLLVIISYPLFSQVPENTDEKADAVVVLGADATPYGAPSPSSTERAYVGSQVLLAGRAPLLVLTGASGEDSLGGAKAMRVISRGLGIPDSRILLVPGFNTYHEGVSARRVLAGSGVEKIVLVTDAEHLPRGMAVFRKQGFSVSSHSVPPPEFSWIKGFTWGNIGRLRRICHEYMGIFYYWMRGWIDWPGT